MSINQRHTAPGLQVDKLGIIADIHGYEEPLEMVLARFRESGITAIACLGDIGCGGQALDKVIKMLDSHSIQTAAGNHDRSYWSDPSFSDAEKKYLSKLRPSFSVIIRGRRYGCWHDNPMFKIHVGRKPFERSNGITNIEQARYVLEGMAEQEYHAMFVGHGHRPRGWMRYRGEVKQLDVSKPVEMEPDASYILAPGCVAEPKVLTPHAVAHPKKDCDAHYGILDAVNLIWTVKSIPLFRDGKPVFEVKPENSKDYV